MALLTNETYQIIDSHNHYLTDPLATNGETKLEVGKDGDDKQVWKVGPVLTNTTLISGMLLYLQGEAVDGGKATCVADLDSASNWSLTSDSSDSVTIELLDSSGRSLSPSLYLVPTGDDKKAWVSKTGQKWKFNQKAVRGNGGTP